MNTRSLICTLVVAVLAVAVGLTFFGQRAGAQTPIPDTSPTVGPRPPADFTVRGKIAFVVKGDIWRWSDGKSERITRGNHYQGPAWSPDGNRLAAAFLGENHSDLVVLNESGTTLSEATDHLAMTSILDQAWARNPAWSPDGRRIAYVSDLWGTGMSLWAAGPDGADARRLVSQPYLSAGLDSPTWAPDGGAIAYVLHSITPSQIVVLDLESGGGTQLTEHSEGAYDAAWSPDGRFIAYVARHESEHDIWLADLEAEKLIRLTEDGKARAPAWAPDGTMVAYASLQGDVFDVRVVRLHLIDGRVVASEPKFLTRGVGIDPDSGLSWAR